MNFRNETLLKAIGLGLIAGMRTMMAPAAAGWGLARHPTESRAVGLVSSSTVTKVLMVMAAGELIVDKLPWTPDRIALPSLAGRVISGAVCGAFGSNASRNDAVIGGFAGGLSAVGSAYASFHIRQRLSREFPDLTVAIAEDALAVTGAVIIANISIRPESVRATETDV